MKDVLLTSILVLIMALTGCNLTSQATSSATDKVRARNEGYTLLYSLASKDSDAGKIFFIKHARLQVVTEIKQISQVYKDAKQKLDDFKIQDPTLNYSVSDLPEIEVKTRDAIEATYTKKLLFSSGTKFEVEFLQAQIRSLDYAAHLAKMIGVNEDSKTRKAYLTEFAKQCDQHHKIIIDLLASLGKTP